MTYSTIITLTSSDEVTLTCGCHELQEIIDTAHPDTNWNCNLACEMWNTCSSEIERNEDVESCVTGRTNIGGCNCPVCGRAICRMCA